MGGTGMTKIVTLGEVLVEIMAEERGAGFRQPLHLIGPFPSGAPAIFIDQVARLGHPCGIVACVGDDDFGALCVDRLRGDGVDVSAIQIDPERVTGSAFVRYRENGERDFVFNIAHSACGQTALTSVTGGPVTGAAEALLREAGHLHVVGSSLFSPRLVDATRTAIELIKGRGGTVSFDPNLRKEMLGDAERHAALRFALRSCDIFLPSGPELTLLTEAQTERDAVAEVLGMGAACVAVKQGAAGASYHDRERTVRAPGFAAEEVDPTGAGDCFGAVFVTCRLQGRSVEECLRYANAAGARTVSVRGPMEGASSFAQLDAFIAARRGQAG